MEVKTSEVTPKTKRGGWWVTVVVAAGVAALMLVGGVVVANRFTASGGGEGGRPFGARPNFQMQAAPELPTTAPSARGVLTKRDGSTLTVGVRNGFPGSGDTGAAQIVTVIVNSDTALYHDVTQLDAGGQPPSGSIQQKVEAGTVDQIGTNSRITVWGDQNGDQIAAKVVVYSDPMNFRQP